MSSFKLFIAFLFFCSIQIISPYQLKARDGKKIYESDVVNGAAQFNKYMLMVTNKTIAVVANQTSMIGKSHLVDTLMYAHTHIKCVFSPEHGFRGQAAAGEKVGSGVDKKTGLKVVSLYGKHLKPTKEDLQGVQIVLFDIQDVGARFYTYISTMQYMMEACAENNILFVVLDRPNPNGFYVDGPVLDTAYKSFVGMQRIPIVHGMTMGEYAQMINYEGWLGNKKRCHLEVIPVKDYTHSDLYQLPVWPSPNLNSMSAIYLYPSICLFEGTNVSLGRGTDYPFTLIGFPGFKEGDTTFTPQSRKGFVSNPPYEDTLCRGIDLREFGERFMPWTKAIKLSWLLLTYEAFAAKDKFFIPYFTQLAGNKILQQQIINGQTEKQISDSWQQDIAAFKKIRKKYLLYPDFE